MRKEMKQVIRYLHFWLTFSPNSTTNQDVTKLFKLVGSFELAQCFSQQYFLLNEHTIVVCSIVLIVLIHMRPTS